MKAKTPGCPACNHLDALAIDRMLLMDGVGKGARRGPRSLAPLFGLDRRDLARHEKACLTDERREKAMAGLWGMARDIAPEAVRAHRDERPTRPAAGGGGVR